MVPVSGQGHPHLCADLPDDRAFEVVQDGVRLGVPVGRADPARLRRAQDDRVTGTHLRRDLDEVPALGIVDVGVELDVDPE